MIDHEELKIDKVVFEGDVGGYYFKATYLHEPKGEALVQISKDGKTVKEFLFPSYKVWNIAAHASDIINGLERDNDNGLYMAGSDGLGGNCYSPEKGEIL